MPGPAVPRSELPARWPLCEQLLPHALALADTPHETAHAVALVELLGQGCWYQEAGRTVEAIAIYEPLLADFERLLGAEHPHTLSTRNNLANAYREAGRTTDAERVRRPQT